MSQFFGLPLPVLRVKAGEAGAGARSVTAAGPVPTFRLFSQLLRLLAPKGRAVTSAGLRPPPPPVRDRGARAGARDRLRAPLRGPLPCASSCAWRADAVRTRCCRSSASATRTVSACTNRGTRNSVDATSSWVPFPQRVRGARLPRLLRARYRGAGRRSDPGSGSPNRRRVDLIQAAAKGRSRRLRGVTRRAFGSHPWSTRIGNRVVR